MTAAQRRLARHALGLAYGDTKRTYRNRFCAVRGTPDNRDWRALTDAGQAWRWPWGWSGGDFYALTRTGAQAALKRGERLDPEDFPS